jgi:outer membrane protein OmpA-like peptidoglycan-associated protein
MRIPKVILPLLAIVGVGIAGSFVAACHAEGHAQVAINDTSSASASVSAPPPATTDSTPPPPATTAPPAVVKITLKGAQMKGASQVDIPGAIDFKTGSGKLDMTKNTTGVLTQVQSVLKNNPEITLMSVEGNTDNAGEDKGFDNVKLSQDRANSVVDWLTKNGIDPKRLNAVGNGSKMGLFPNDSAEHKAANRNVQFHLILFNGQPVPHDSSAGAGGGSTTPAATTAATAPATSSSSAVGGGKKGK